MKFGTNKNIGLTVEGLEKVTNVLKGFDDIVNAEFGNTVTVDDGVKKYTRKATKEDELDIIKNEWANAIQELSELGINIEEETVEEQTCYIYFELSEVVEQAYIDGEYAELEYNGMIIQYDGLRKASDDMLIFYKDIDDESTEVARIILNENANYEINKTSKYSVELVRK